MNPELVNQYAAAASKRHVLVHAFLLCAGIIPTRTFRPRAYRIKVLLVLFGYNGARFHK